MIGREVLLLDDRASPIAIDPVDEDNRWIAGAHLVVGDAGPIAGGDPLRHVIRAYRDANPPAELPRRCGRPSV